MTMRRRSFLLMSASAIALLACNPVREAGAWLHPGSNPGTLQTVSTYPGVFGGTVYPVSGNVDIRNSTPTFSNSGGGVIASGIRGNYFGVMSISAAVNDFYLISVDCTFLSTPTGSPTAGFAGFQLDGVLLDGCNSSGVPNGTTYQNVTSNGSLYWRAGILAGTHNLGFYISGDTSQPYIANKGNAPLGSATTLITPLGIGLPLEPAGSRDPTIYPGSSWHYYNRPVGSGAVPSLLTDADQIQLSNIQGGNINITSFASNFYTGKSSDPIQLAGSGDNFLTPANPASFHMPGGTFTGNQTGTTITASGVTGTIFVGAVVAGTGITTQQIVAFGSGTGGAGTYITDTSQSFSGVTCTAAMQGSPSGSADRKMGLFDATQTRWAPSGYGSIITPSPATFGIQWSQQSILDQYNGFNHGLTQGEAIFGIIREQEVTAGAINHVLLCSLQEGNLKNVANQFLGLRWPGAQCDFNAPSTYTGAINYGSRLYIPSTVNLATLGLSPGGLILATCLQNYGATIQITQGGGSGGPLDFYHQSNGTGSDNTLMTEMLTDLLAIGSGGNDLIVPQLRILTNDGPNSIGGGGTPLVPLLPGVGVLTG